MVNQAYSRCVVFRRTFFPRHLYLSRMLLRDSKVIRNYREKYELQRMEKVKRLGKRKSLAKGCRERRVGFVLLDTRAFSGTEVTTFIEHPV